ncbi:MAG: GNAT family N-acetyltransferase [Chloroflexota bacterium]
MTNETIKITPSKPNSEEAVQLIQELEDVLNPLYPSESRHGYSVDKLIQQNVSFFIVRVDGKAAGCGGIQFYDEYGELKRMYVRPNYRGRKLGQKLVEFLCAYALKQHINIVRLETGIHQKAAIRLYESAGFVQIPPFGEYFEDPNSRCYEKQLS